MIDFTGQVALVTGAGRGLGFAYANALADRGATVILQDSGVSKDGTGRDTSVAPAAADRIRSSGRAFAALDPINTREACAALVARILEKHDRLDILIHNAGWVGYQFIEELEPEFLDRMMRLSVDTSLWLAQAAWPRMREAGFGRILLTTSDRAIYPAYAQKGLVAYAAAKLATVGIVNVLALEGEKHGIKVNAISPVAKTRMWDVEDRPDELKPESVAAGALFLVSSACDDSGLVLRAAGGQFVATSAREADGVSYPRDLAGVHAQTPEDVAALWAKISVNRPEPRNPHDHAIGVAVHAMATIGESPFWSDRRRCLLWVDTEARTLNRFDPATGCNRPTSMPDVVGLVTERDDGILVVALGCDLATVTDEGNIERFATAPDGGEAFRLNDGRYDRQGRLWIGLMDKMIGEGTGILYRFDPDGRWHVIDRGFTLINGLDWSPDYRALYVTDSRGPAIYAYAYDEESGTIQHRRPFATFGPDDGFPDGLLVTEDGGMWSTLFNGNAILRIEADGRFSHRMMLPVSRPTCCALGPDGATLYVTTARLGLDEKALQREPLAGSVLRIERSPGHGIAAFARNSLRPG